MAEPGGSGPIGPYPPGVGSDDEKDEYDRLRRRVLWTMPSGLYVVGSRARDRRNVMTLNWATQVSFEPKLLGIGVEKTSVTHELIESGGSFTLNTIDREDRAIVRKFTKPVEVDTDAHDAQRLPVPRRRHGRADPRPRPWRGSTARCDTRSTPATTPSSSVKSSTAASRSRRTPRCCGWKTPG